MVQDSWELNLRGFFFSLIIWKVDSIGAWSKIFWLPNPCLFLVYDYSLYSYFYPCILVIHEVAGTKFKCLQFAAIPFRVEDANNEKNQMYREASKEVKAGADMNGHGITDSTSVHVAGDDLVFVNNVLSARNTVNGTFTSLSQSLL